MMHYTAAQLEPAPSLWLESEFDEFSDELQPGSLRSALAKFRQLRMAGRSYEYAREVCVQRWGF